MKTQCVIDRTLTVNEIVARCPQTMGVFNRFGVDTCCGGGATIPEAAQRDGFDAAALFAALDAVAVAA